MNPWDEEALREINSLESARLAIRGALATIRDLQELNAQAKVQAQDETARRKSAEARSSEISAQLDEFKKQGEEWEKEKLERARIEEQWKESARLSARAEEKARIESERAEWEGELSRLGAEMQRMAEAARQGEVQFSELKKELEAKDVQLMAAERYKLELSNRFHRDSELV